MTAPNAHDVDLLATALSDAIDDHHEPDPVGWRAVATDLLLKGYRLHEAPPSCTGDGREAETPTRKPWSGASRNWIAPVHFCPTCGESLSWEETVDVWDEPIIWGRCRNCRLAITKYFRVGERDAEPTFTCPSCNKTVLAGAHSCNGDARDAEERAGTATGT